MDISRITAEVQATQATWRPPTGVLGRLVSEAVARAAALEPRREELERAAARAERRAPFAAALRAGGMVAVIAEVKRRSPSRGDISPLLGAAAQALSYEAGGAAAVSVLTEPVHFGGSIADLEEAARATHLPLLRKDFLVSEAQLAEARAYGASAALLIARALSPERLRALAASAERLGLEALIEVRSEHELDVALGTGARVIGVNARDLETLEVDRSVSERLLALVPADRIAVAESGLSGVQDVERAALAGADAVLVGSALSAASDPASAVAAIARVPRRSRRGA